MKSQYLWLDDELQPTVKRQVTTVVHMPPMTEKKLWKVPARYHREITPEETGR